MPELPDSRKLKTQPLPESGRPVVASVVVNAPSSMSLEGVCVYLVILIMTDWIYYDRTVSLISVVASSLVL